MPSFWKVGRSFRGAFEGGERNVLLGLVPSVGEPEGPPRLVALEPHKTGSPGRVDPKRVVEAVEQALSDYESASGTKVALEVIEYIPNDSAYYEAYYNLACKLLPWIARET